MCTAVYSPNNLFKIAPIIESNVEKFLKTLDTKKATGLANDGIDAKFLKLAGPYIIKTLTYATLASLQTVSLVHGKLPKSPHYIRKIIKMIPITTDLSSTP